jgi:guanylate kinase
MPAAPHRRGLLFIVSAPSGTGKTTLVRRATDLTPGLRMSRSYTSRGPRPGERDGIDYTFMTRERFQAMIGREEFLEWAEVFGDLYATSASDTEALLAAGIDLVLVIDVQGARKVRARGVKAVSIFLMPPTYGALEARLRGRSKDSEAQIRRRLEVAREEVRAFGEYDYVVVNDDIDRALEGLRAIVLAERARTPAARDNAERILATFGAVPGTTRERGE